MAISKQTGKYVIIILVNQYSETLKDQSFWGCFDTQLVRVKVPVPYHNGKDYTVLGS